LLWAKRVSPPFFFGGLLREPGIEPGASAWQAEILPCGRNYWL
jgi:hypothetical protein